MLPLTVILPWLLLLQDPAPGGAPRFTSGTELVVLHVTVLDRRSAFVGDLPPEAFRVYEDGRPQDIGFFERSDGPVTVGLLIDSSISMHRIRPAVLAAASSFADAAHPDDEMFTINFNEHVWPGLPAEQRFTSDPGELRAALQRSTARGQTALFDALLAGLRQLEHGQRQKKVLVVLSDGGDNASRSDVADVLDAALRMDAVIYAVSIHDQYNRDGDPKLLRKLAAATGGTVFFLRSEREVQGTLQQIARDIRSGYTLGYVPDRSDGTGGYRSLRVVVDPPDRRRLTVRSRPGYQASGGATP
jgi:Ca-activated chloride channel homolog